MAFSPFKEFQRPHTWHETIVFYLVTLLGAALLGAIGATVGIVLFAPNAERPEIIGFRIGLAVSLVTCVACTILIARKQKRGDMLMLVALVLGTAVLSGMGAATGLLIPAYLCLRGPQKSGNEKPMS